MRPIAIYPLLKRTIDIITSLVAILPLALIWLLTAILVKLTSAGPVFFVQPRGGRNGRPFNLLKFRTMRTDHVHDPTEFMPLTHSGITPIGRLLRRTKIDESPQLINVLKGDMSLVGPRPTIMEQVEAYDDFQRRRLEVRPGITGLAQINGNTAIDWPERIRYDVWYVDHLGFGLDLTILFKTVMVVLRGDKRYARPFDESPYAEPPR